MVRSCFFLLNGYKKCISSLNRCYIYNLVLLAISKQDIVLLENNWTFITLLKCYILFKQLQKGEINERIREKENMMNLIFFSKSDYSLEHRDHMT